MEFNQTNQNQGDVVNNISKGEEVMSKKVVPPCPFTPRNDGVIVFKVTVDELRGIKVPTISAEAKEYRVGAFGPDVKDLKVGDRVLIVGSIGEDFAFVPGSTEWIFCRQANVVLKYQEFKPTNTENKEENDA